MAHLPAFNPVRIIGNIIKTVSSATNINVLDEKAVPYLGLIPSGLRPSQMIRIRGVINQHVMDHIVINIQTGAAISPPDDCNLHLSVRLNENVIVRNDRQRGAWGAVEERYGGCPLARGQTFEVLILAEQQGFKVALNGRHFCEFAHRMPLDRAKFVFIKGELTVQSISIEGDVPSAPPMPAAGAHASNQSQL